MHESGEDEGGGDRRPATQDPAGELPPGVDRSPRATGRGDVERTRRSGSADDGHVEGGEGAAEMDAEIERRDSGGGPGLRATEFDIARLPPD